MRRLGTLFRQGVACRSWLTGGGSRALKLGPVAEAVSAQLFASSSGGSVVAEESVDGQHHHGFGEEEGEDAVIPPLEQQKLLRAGIMGAPNAGKSELTNKLVGNKITAVSPKTGTTRKEIVGVSTTGDVQLLLYDTPGVSKPRPGHSMKWPSPSAVSSAWSTAERCDVLMMLVDAHRQALHPDPRVERLLNTLYEDLPPAVLVLNKVDLLGAKNKKLLLPLAEALMQQNTFSHCFMISAINGSGVEELKQHLFSLAANRPWEFPPEAKTAQADDELVLEVIREYIYTQLHQEVPYLVQLKLLEWEDFRNGDLKLEVAAYVSSESQRMILVGRNGDVIRGIGSAARLQLEKLFTRKVHLYLYAKVLPSR
eukprot:jgi/Chlat1/3976/Chrsp26S08872